MDIKAKISTLGSCLDKMISQLRNGKEKGTTTYIDKLDQCWTWRKGEFNIWTGYSNEGKSLFLRFLCIIKALKDDWKFVFSAPEDYPPEEFYDDMIHTLAGFTTDNQSPYHLSEADYLRAADKIKENFYFLYLEPPDNTIKSTIDEFKMLCDSTHIDACIIDPLIKFARPTGMSDRDDIYAAYITTLCTDFCRKMNLSLHLVMHQLTPRLGDNQQYPKPSMYSVKGGGTWADGVDNVLSVWRPHYAKDKINDEVIFSSLKIKKQKLVGVPQDVTMRFDRRSNRYIDFDTKKSMFDFDSIMYPKIITKI